MHKEWCAGPLPGAFASRRCLAVGPRQSMLHGTGAALWSGGHLVVADRDDAEDRTCRPQRRKRERPISIGGAGVRALLGIRTDRELTISPLLHCCSHAPVPGPAVLEQICLLQTQCYRGSERLHWLAQCRTSRRSRRTADQSIGPLDPAQQTRPPVVGSNSNMRGHGLTHPSHHSLARMR